MHILIAALPEHRWTLWKREHDTWSVLLDKANRLQPVVDQALDVMFKPNATTDLTFSTRPAEAVMADMIKTPEALATGALGCEIEVLCREGRLEAKDDRWARVRRLHGRMEPFSLGVPADVFRPQTLKAEILNWFEKEGWHTFGPRRPGRQESVAPPYGRELLVRHGDDWRARQLCPADFPRFQPGAVISAVDEAKRLSKLPQSKSATRRAKQQANLERFRKEAAERAALREEQV